MSHLTTIDIEVKDLNALATACQSLGLVLRRDQKTFRTYAGARTSCEAAIVDTKNARAYEIGVVRTNDRLVLQYDGWNNGDGMQDIVGNNCSRLVQEYARAVTLRTARQQGMRVSETRMADGSIRLKLQPQTLKQRW